MKREVWDDSKDEALVSYHLTPDASPLTSLFPNCLSTLLQIGVAHGGIEIQRRFLDSLELTRKRYNFEVLGYVVMPEHVHLLLSEPLDHEVPLSKALQFLKLSVSKRLTPKPFWQTRYYDFNVFTHNKRVEKLKYMHRNPVTRSLVERPEDWPWSSYCHYLLDKPSPVRRSRL